jgi:hypothetical protein
MPASTITENQIILTLLFFIVIFLSWKLSIYHLRQTIKNNSSDKPILDERITSINSKLDKLQRDLDGLSENIIELELFELNHHLNMAIANENYEEAQKLKNVIDDINNLRNKK